MNANYDYDIMLFGHFAKDRNVIDGQGKIESGGGVYFGSIALRHLGLRVAVVTRLHPDDFPRLDEMKQEGVDVFAKPAPQTSGIENTYNSANMDRRTCKPLGFAGPIRIADVPDKTARIYAITPIIAGEMDLEFLKALSKRGPVALDVQGFVRVREGDDLVFRPWKEMAEGLAYVTYLKVDRAEAEFLTGETDLARAARKLSALGPREIALTQTAGLMVFADGQIYSMPFTLTVLAGRTGRGDTCFSSYLGRRLSASPEDSCRFAAAVTTLKQQKPGPWRGTTVDVEKMMRDT
jgi:sugar/nucleoside kinase (ribokinase family)